MINIKCPVSVSFEEKSYKLTNGNVESDSVELAGRLYPRDAPDPAGLGWIDKNLYSFMNAWGCLAQLCYMNEWLVPGCDLSLNGYVDEATEGSSLLNKAGKFIGLENGKPISKIIGYVNSLDPYSKERVRDRRWIVFEVAMNPHQDRSCDPYVLYFFNHLTSCRTVRHKGVFQCTTESDHLFLEDNWYPES